jgi:hypothetical protein
VTDLRCDDCVAIGCDCPRGYFAAKVRCEECGERFTVLAAACAIRPLLDDCVPCPKCRGRSELVELVRSAHAE